MKKIFLLLVIIIVSKSVFSVTAFPEKIQFSQPDGQKVTLTMKGDEYVKYAETEDVYTLLYDTAGFFNYAYINADGNLVPSQFHAHDISLRTEPEILFLQTITTHLFYSEAQINTFIQIREMVETQMAQTPYPHTRGTIKFLCILMEYADKPFVKTNADFYNLLNQVGYNTGGADGSVHDFYAETSYNSVNLIFDVVGPFTSIENAAYYGNNNNGDAGQLIYEGVMHADSLVDFSDYDNDEDGNVDGLYVIFAGNGEEAGAGADAIWSHAGGLDITADGVHLGSYACSPECRGASGSSITYIGVICHELGHVLGAPDYYDTNYETGGSYEGTGYWDLMASGSWNNSGRTPAHQNPRIKIYTYQWAEVTLLTDTQTVVIPPSIYYANAFYRINTATNNEYFLIENRALRSFDQAIPGNGMVIYRCASNINSGSINSTHKQKFYPVAANSTQSLPTAGQYGAINAASCSWPGTLNKTTFTDQTTPSMKSWANANTNKPITNISLNSYNDIITFNLMGGDTLTSFPIFLPQRVGVAVSPVNGSVSPVSPGGSFSFTVNLDSYFSNSNFIVRVGTDTLTAVNNIYTILNINEPKVVEILNISINKYPVIAFQNMNGTISPADTTLVNYFANITYNITPAVGYAITDVFVDSVSVGNQNSYTFTNVIQPHSIYATFGLGSPDIIQTSLNNLSFATFQNTPSDTQQVMVSADVSQLTINVLVKAPLHFQVSINGTTWGSQLVIQKSNLPQLLHVRFLPSIVGQISDTIKISSAGAMTYLFVQGTSTVGIQDYQNDDILVQLYPNPATQNVYLKTDRVLFDANSCFGYLYDITGQLIISVPINKEITEFEIADLVPGIYLVAVQNGSKKIFKKLIVQ
jgi:M6 family metalloprotease-like protein